MLSPTSAVDGGPRRQKHVDRLPLRLAAVCVMVVVGVCGVVGQTTDLSVGARGRMPGIASGPPKVVDPSYARVWPPEMFKAMDIVARRMVMSAWAATSAENAGPSILPLLEAALLDQDRDVRLDGITVLIRIESAAHRSRLKGERPTTDPTAYGLLYETLRTLLSDHDSVFRSHVISALLRFEHPPKISLEEDLIELFKREQASIVRVTIVQGLGEFVRAGSTGSRRLILNALEDADIDVQIASINVVGRTRMTEGLPRIVEKVPTAPPSVRTNIIRALRSSGELATPHVPALVEWLTHENDPVVRLEIAKLIESRSRSQSSDSPLR
jgi:hypothetical protein